MTADYGTLTVTLPKMTGNGYINPPPTQHSATPMDRRTGTVETVPTSSNITTKTEPGTPNGHNLLTGDNLLNGDNLQTVDSQPT